MIHILISETKSHPIKRFTSCAFLLGILTFIMFSAPSQVSAYASPAKIDISFDLNASTQLDYCLSYIGDDCGCEMDFIGNMILIEGTYAASLAVCPMTGPGVLVCVGVATAAKVASTAYAGYQLSNCNSMCLEMHDGTGPGTGGGH